MGVDDDERKSGALCWEEELLAPVSGVALWRVVVRAAKRCGGKQSREEEATSPPPPPTFFDDPIPIFCVGRRDDAKTG